MIHGNIFANKLVFQLYCMFLVRNLAQNGHNWLPTKPYQCIFSSVQYFHWKNKQIYNANCSTLYNSKRKAQFTWWITCANTL